MVYGVLALITVLSVASLSVIVAFAVYPPLRTVFPFYDPIADWIGHGIPDIGMLYMVAVMAGAPALLPFSWCAAFFAASALIFLTRMATRRYFWWLDLLRHWGVDCVQIDTGEYLWWQDALHLGAVACKIYMFVSVVYWHEWITAHAIVFFVGMIFLYIYRTINSIQGKTGLPFGRLLFNIEHIVMSVAAILMFALMQWPLYFIDGGNMLCQGSPPAIHSH